GSYILKSVERKTFDVSSKAKIAGIYIDEFVAPKPDKLSRLIVHHQPPRILSTSSDFKIKADIYGLKKGDSVSVFFQPLSGRWRKIPMCKRGVNYEVSIPQDFLSSGLLRYYIVIQTPKGNITFPGGY